MAKPSWNVAPTAESFVFRRHEDILLERLSWGFPTPARGASALLINARIETAATKTAFRDAWRAQRCIVPVDGWYEWKLVRGRKQPIYFSLPSGEPILMAGLWQADRFVLMTTESYSKLREVHHRRPVALDLDGARGWLDSATVDWEGKDVAEALVPETSFDLRPITSAVSNARNDGPEIILEATAPPAPEQPDLFPNPA